MPFAYGFASKMRALPPRRVCGLGVDPARRGALNARTATKAGFLWALAPVRVSWPE